MQENADRSMAEGTWTPAGSNTTDPEAVWVLAAQRGDTVAFNRLVLRWERSIYNLGLRMLHDPEEAAEATQEVFWSAHRNLRRFQSNARFSTWLYRIAVNQCLSRLRKRPPGIHISLDDPGPGNPLHAHAPSVESHEKGFLAREERRQVRQALDSLPEDQRVVVELKFYQELTFDEMAGVLETPVSTIKTRFYAALDLLKHKLAGGRATN